MTSDDKVLRNKLKSAVAPPFHKCTSLTDKTTSFNILIGTSHISFFTLLTLTQTNTHIRVTKPFSQHPQLGFLSMALW